jgi:hypothetical protein
MQGLWDVGCAVSCVRSRSGLLIDERWWLVRMSLGPFVCFGGGCAHCVHRPEHHMHIQCDLVADRGYSHQHPKSYHTVNQSKHQLKICSVSISRTVFPLNTSQTRAGLWSRDLTAEVLTNSQSMHLKLFTQPLPPPARLVLSVSITF